ncbi:MAG: hypothetical protein HC854_13015 [Flavobacterium sp.]|nr:hypothetical protein [Flavobacterium sp.]
MKKINFLFTSIAVIAIFSFASCTVEPLDPVLSGQVEAGNGNGSGNGNTGGGTGGTYSGDYWPTAINNTWSYERDATISTLKIGSTETINGQLYYKFLPQSGSGSTTSGTVTTSLNKNSGVYKLKTDDININAGGLTGTQTGYEFIVLKDNIATGETWNGTYSQTTTYTGIPAIIVNTNYTGTILEKNVNATVNGETYTNVIKVKIVQAATFPGAPATTINTEYWFAKNVGIIKSVSTSNGTSYTSNLVDYTLF